jgi:septum site-determining protein MinC
MPRVLIRGRSFMALVMAPELPLGNWLAALDQQMGRSAGFFADRPVIANLARVIEAGKRPQAALDALDALHARDLRVIGVEGIHAAVLAGTRWDQLPTLVQGRSEGAADRPLAGPADPPAAPAAAPPSLLIDRPVRSGQSIYFEDGDITVIGSVASGAEVIAGGSIHVYGALRGRAIAGLKTGGAARIFCRRLEAEFIAVDELYRTAEHWGERLHGCAVQVRQDRGALRISALD